MTSDDSWQVHLRATIHAACVLEATARKPGNVHPGAAFEDVRFEDFVRSADVIAPILAETQQLGVGSAIREAVSVTRRAVGKNTNLGIILLIAPLAAVPEGMPLGEGICQILDDLTVDDARHCFEAIRIAQPGGLGNSGEQDVQEAPTVTLREAMQLASERDRVAAQYANGFRDVLEFGVPILLGPDWADERERAVIRLHLRLMAEYPDTLISRKCGPAVAVESARMAKSVLDAGWPTRDAGAEAFDRFDDWLRADGHRRNPGTSADLVAATLFAALRERPGTV